MNLILRWLGGAAGPYILAALAIVIAGMGATILLQRVTISAMAEAQTRHLLEDEQAKTQALQDARDREHRHAADVAAAQLKHQEELEHEKHEAARIIADVERGTLKLRQQFRACWRNLSGATTSTPSGNGEAEGGLQAADVEFLVRLADEADTIVHQLGLAQSVIEADRKTCR